MLGAFVKIKEQQIKLVTRTVTSKSEQKNITDDNYIPPSGHMMFIKNKLVNGSDVCAQLVSLGGAKMADGRTWSMASSLMSRTVEISEDGLNLGNLTVLKSFQITASHKNRTSKGSVTPNLMNAAGVDLEPEESSIMNLVIYGGQFTDKVVTSDEVITIKGNVQKNISGSDIDVTRFPSKPFKFQEFVVPDGWSKGEELIQKGDIPTGRTGAGWTKLKSGNGSTFLLSTGGHSKLKVTQPFFHPNDSINILEVPEMSWRRLEGNDHFKRSFHSQAVDKDGHLFIVGGKSLIDGRWSRIHPINEIVKITFNEDYSYTGSVVTLQSDILELSLLTNFSCCTHENKMFFFSGFKFPNYKEDNLHKFLPPNTSRDKLPELGTNLYKIDLEEGTISVCEGPEDCGANNGSILMLNPQEMVITADPRMYLFSERMVQAPKCDLHDEFGSCSLSMTSKNRDSYKCATPACGKVIHIKCDKSIRGGGKVSDKKLCPSCNNLDPVTWKKIKMIRLANRR